jgi:hypothetical protein
LSESELGLLRIVETTRSFDGDPRLLKLAIQAYALGIAYEFDPYFGLSISRVLAGPGGFVECFSPGRRTLRGPCRITRTSRLPDRAPKTKAPDPKRNSGYHEIGI